MLTQERLKELLDYHPQTGLFTRRRPWRDRPIGSPVGSAGGPKDKRSILIKVDGKTYFAHRLAVLWMTGKWPSEQVDHKNLNKLDNSWENLRDATCSQNCMNRRRRRNKMPGVSKGVFFRKDKRSLRKWRAVIMIDGRRINLGHYATEAEAAKVYADAAAKFHREFARVA